MRQRMVRRRGWRKRRSIVVHQRYYWVRDWVMVGLKAIVVTPIKATEGRVWAIEVWHSQGPTRGGKGVGRALMSGQGGCRRTSGRHMERRWRMVRGWSRRVNRGRMGTVGRRVWRSM